MMYYGGHPVETLDTVVRDCEAVVEYVLIPGYRATWYEPGQPNTVELLSVKMTDTGIDILETLSEREEQELINTIFWFHDS